MALKDIAKLVKNMVEERAPEEEFLHFYKSAVVKQNLAKARKPSQTYKPSSLGGCLRKMFFEVTGVETDPDYEPTSELAEMGDSGTDRHDRIQRTIMAMKDMGFPVEWIDVEEFLKMRPVAGTRVIERQGNEVKLRNDILNLSFLCDGIIKLNGRYYILEIKTEVSFKYSKRKCPEDDHKTQATCYSIALGVDRVLFFYENRDMCSKKPFIYVVTEEDKATRVMGNIEEVENHVSEGTIPAKTLVVKHCNYCKYKKECAKYA